MSLKTWMRSLLTPAIAGGMLLVAGCSQPASDTAPVAATDEHAEHEHAEGEAGHSHNGYWCVEHGMPEEICVQCDPKLAVKYQQAGDWCEEHNVPDSQCFIHHPELEQKFIAQYVAKFGEEPPPREAEEHADHDHEEHADHAD